jgi:hypothetical protein
MVPRDRLTSFKLGLACVMGDETLISVIINRRLSFIGGCRFSIWGAFPCFLTPILVFSVKKIQK